ncbi:Protein of unknown function [Leuconostoc citreum LBAE C10]|nr:Protein of unknown function [Leuconostoc citreum LBAE C10]
MIGVDELVYHLVDNGLALVTGHTIQLGSSPNARWLVSKLLVIITDNSEW